MDTTAPSVIEVEYRGRVAMLTISNEKKLNALNGGQYFELAQKMREVAARDDIFVTVLIGKGRYFSAGADVKSTIPTSISSSSTSTSPSSSSPPTPYEQRATLLSTFAANNLNIAHAFYNHPKVLVAALNGPALGLSAALVAHADFVYAAPHAFLLTPFSSIGLVAEGLASRALVRRLGVARANEALLMSRAIPAAELLACGFVNRIFEDEGQAGAEAQGADVRFRERVLREIDERLGPHLSGESLLGIKQLIQRPEREVMDAQNVAEVMAGVERFLTGLPAEQFRKLASGQKRHKL